MAFDGEWEARFCYTDERKIYDSLQQAFGPHAEWHVDRRTPIAKASKVIVAACLIGLVCVLWVFAK